METSADEYTAFEEKVKKTVYFDNLSPQVNEVVLEKAIDQFGNVVKVEFIPNYISPYEPYQVALVEMETKAQAEAVIMEMNNSPFMIQGMPRPVRAFAAKAEMFDDRPRKSGRNLTICWLDHQDPNFETAQKIKRIIRKQDAEAQLLLKLQLEEEEKLANLQAETLKVNYTKYEMVEGILMEGTVHKLAGRYNMHLSDA